MTKFSVKLLLIIITMLAATSPLLSRERTQRSPKPVNGAGADIDSFFNPPAPDAFTPGTVTVGQAGIQYTSKQLMDFQAALGITKKKNKILPLFSHEERKTLSQNPLSPAVAFFSHTQHLVKNPTKQLFKDPQTVTINFLGAQLSDVSLFPPDSMGAVGPSQFVMAINGLLRTFDKNTGAADNVLNIDMDVFFDSVRDGSFTSDPRIRYDRLSDRWFITIVNVPPTFENNRLLIAVSDGGDIVDETVWTFFFFEVGNGVYLDYETLGIDKYALYIGGRTFSNTDTGKVFVVRKSTVLGTGPITVTSFSNIINATTGEGPFSPQGVDNFDENPTYGYFVGVDNATFGTIMIRRIANPGGIPLISGNIPLVIPNTQFPIRVQHLGNTNAFNGELDAVDDRLLSAHIRDGLLITVHNIGVDNTGVSPIEFEDASRNGSRFYIIDTTPILPVLDQVGTLYTPSGSNTLDQRSYWMPSVMSNGQQALALGCSTAGVNEYINAATAGRLATDNPNTIQAAILYTTSFTAYNPANDTGSVNRGRRWGDYSFTSVDPCDDMTMWTIQEYCNATDSWGVQIAKLLAPPPATPISAFPSSVASGLSSATITITGSSSAGSGFFDPGSDFNCRISACITGCVTVKSVTFVDPTHVTLVISTVGAITGAKNVTITNPDDQSATGIGILTIT